MTSLPVSPSRRAPLLGDRQELLDSDTDEELMDTSRSNEPDNNHPEVGTGTGGGGGGGHTSFPTYGSVQKKADRAPPLEEKLKKKHRASSIVSLSSFGELFTKDGYARLEEKKQHRRDTAGEDDDSSDDETPPLFEFHFRRNTKDKVKLVVLPILYFSFMLVAFVFGFYTIDALVLSYKNKVRSIKYVTVEEYHTIGVAMFPQDFAIYEGCSFIYSDDLLPRPDNISVIQPDNKTCRYTNVTFMSHLIKANRTAMVFDGPTLVVKKQSLAVNFTIDTTAREFSGMEYLLLEKWEEYRDASLEKQAQYLSQTEKSMPLFTVPAGFRTWIKMSLTVLSSSIDNVNITNFQVDPGFSTFNDWRNITDRTTDIIYALFEWKSNTYEFVTEIITTNLYNTLGALAGVFITLARAGEYCWQWIRRIRREKRKKGLKHSELEQLHRQKMQEFQQRKLERRLKRLQSASVMVAD